MLPQITEIILAKKPLVYVEMKVRKQHLPGVCSERGAADPADTVLLATNQKTVKGESRSNRMRSGASRATWRCCCRCAPAGAAK